MAHYAFLDEDNFVTEVIVGIDETELIEGVDPETWYSNFRGQVCVRTSYNSNIRGNFAGIGYKYDAEKDVFIAPQPFPSWSLNAETLTWDAPAKYPEDGREYYWDEGLVDWTPMLNDEPATTE